MTNQNETLRLFHTQDGSKDESSSASFKHEESGSVGAVHSVRAPKHGAHDPRPSGYRFTPKAEQALPQSIEEIRELAHRLALALTERSEGVDASAWRLRVAAAQARAIEDILAGVEA